MPSPPTEIEAHRHCPLGMPPARFLRDYWQKRPLLIRNALPGFVPPLSPDELAGLACMDGALARIVSHDAKRNRWHVRTGPFDDATFAKLPESRWTLLVQDVDKWDAATAALLDHFAFIPRWRIDDVMVSYATAAGGVGAHVDQYDVFLLQGTGQRRWRISTDPAAPTAFRDESELQLLREFTPTHEWILGPGDMLYLPPGVPHDGVAACACMTYSIGMRAPSVAEMLVDFAAHAALALPESMRYRDPDLHPANGDGEIDEAASERAYAALSWAGLKTGDEQPVRKRARSGQEGFARCALAQAHGDGVEGSARAVPASSLRTWFGSFITRYRSAFDFDANTAPMTQRAFERVWARHALAIPDPRARTAWQREPRGATLFAAGSTWTCTVRLARAVASRHPFDPAACAKSAADRDVLRALAGCGIIRFETVRRKSR